MPAVETRKPAILNDAELAKVRALEATLGDSTVLVAYDRPLEPAVLSDEQLKQVQSLEKELSHVLVVAWRKPSMVCE